MRCSLKALSESTIITTPTRRKEVKSSKQTEEKTRRRIAKMVAVLVAVIAFVLTSSVASAPETMISRGIRGGEEDNVVVVDVDNNGTEEIPQEPACPPGELFMTCGPACPPTCLSIRSPTPCTNECSVGCFCKEGLVRDYSGRCIEEFEC